MLLLMPFFPPRRIGYQEYPLVIKLEIVYHKSSLLVGLPELPENMKGTCR
jgi:hypothetical protein